MRIDSSVVKVSYKDKTKCDTEFMVFAEPEKLDQWTKGDKSIPLVDLVQKFEIYYSVTRGTEGEIRKASKAMLEEEFDTSDENEIIPFILEHGRIIGSKNINNDLGTFQSKALSHEMPVGGNRRA